LKIEERKMKFRREESKIEARGDEEKCPTSSFKKENINAKSKILA